MTFQRTQNNDILKLENQLCFPLYAASREVVKKYSPYLRDLDLTYTQYISMMVLWDAGEISAKSLGERLFLDSGTMTPVLKALEKKGYIKRTRCPEDERLLIVAVTPEGMALRGKAQGIPEKVGACIDLDPAEARSLYRLLYKLLGQSEPAASESARAQTERRPL